jgi:hypothetical protein
MLPRESHAWIVDHMATDGVQSHLTARHLDTDQAFENCCMANNCNAFCWSAYGVGD